MQKKILIIGGILILIVLAVIGWTTKSSTPTQIQPTTNQELPTTNPLPTVVITPQQDIVNDTTHDYAIVYDPVYDLYTINILNNPFDQIRAEAEQALIKKLNLTEDQACSKIKVSIGSPRFVNPNSDPTQTYDTFSFCTK